MDRRTLLEGLGAIVVTASVTGAQQRTEMYGLIGKIKAIPGKRPDLIAILNESSAAMPGSISYVIAEDTADEDTLWVTEVWDSAESHQASLSLPAVKNAIPRARPLISAFEKIAVTRPVARPQTTNSGG